MASEHFDRVSCDVHALVADLLPVLAPKATIDAEAGIVVLQVGETRARVSTESLVRACAEQPNDSWPREVDSWLRQISVQVANALDAREEHGDVEPRLRLRIVPRHGEASDGEYITSPFGRHFEAAVVIDDAAGGQWLTRELASRLALNEPGGRAISNTLDHELPHFEVRDQRASATEWVRVVSREGSSYVPGALLALPQYLPESCPYGALVAIPRYSMMLLYPVVSDTVLSFGPVLAEMVQVSYDNATDGCTPRVFWWFEDRLCLVGAPSGVGEEEARLEVPAELRPLVRRLPRPRRS